MLFTSNVIIQKKTNLNVRKVQEKKSPILVFFTNEKYQTYFCTGSPKSGVRGCKLNENKYSLGYPQPKMNVQCACNSVSKSEI